MITALEKGYHTSYIVSLLLRNMGLMTFERDTSCLFSIQLIVLHIYLADQRMVVSR